MLPRGRDGAAGLRPSQWRAHTGSPSSNLDGETGSAAFPSVPDPTDRAPRQRPSRRWLALLLLLPAAGVPLLLSAASLQPARGGQVAPVAEGGPVLRVLLREAPGLDLGARGGPVRLADAAGRTLLELLPGEALRLSQGPGGSGFLAVLESQAPAAGRSLTLPQSELWLNPRRDRGSGSLIELQQKAYRGRLQLRSLGGNLTAINHIAVESYLPSVVGSEMPASWPQNALRAQAVAARTYALDQRRPAAAYDLKATVASQVYGGVAAETASTREAVAATRGQVLMHGNLLINAVFHSSSGGNTENSGEIWTRQLPYLVSVPDFDHNSPVHRWELSFDPQQLRQAFRETGGLQRLDVLQASSTGRLRRARVIGPAGALELSGTELRQRLGLRSTFVTFRLEPVAPAAGEGVTGTVRRLLAAPLAPPAPPAPAAGWLDSASGPADSLDADASFARRTPAPEAAPLPVLRVSGRGFGHGVGMSQWGALGMAQNGQSYQQILRHYYRGAELRSFPDS
jgi:stage II sporulation protein D